jgi:hypothetical protein
VDVRQPTRPTEVGRWWLPGTRDGDTEPPPPRHPAFDSGYRAHNTNVYPKRPDRAWVGYLDGGAIILDIADKAHPRLVARWDYQPPFPGFCHTLLPLLDRGLLVVSDESVADGAKDWPKLVWILDVREDTKPVPISTCPLPPVKTFARRGGRFGAHNLHENRPAPGTWVSEKVIVGTFFNGGVRAFDVSDPFRPTEVAWAVPPAPRKSRAKAIQLNDVFVDERQIVYTVDRMIGGLYIYEMKPELAPRSGTAAPARVGSGTVVLIGLAWLLVAIAVGATGIGRTWPPPVVIAADDGRARRRVAAPAISRVAGRGRPPLARRLPPHAFRRLLLPLPVRARAAAL